MFDKYSFKQKNKVLLVIFILLMLASYKRSFVLTILALNEIEQQEINLSKIKTSESDLQYLTQSLNDLKHRIGKSNIEPDKVQQEILESLSGYSEKYKIYIESIEETHIFKNVDYSIYSNIITIEGRFNQLVEVLYEMELHFDYARIINVEFFKKKNINTKKTKLYAKILFQHYHQI